MLCSRITLLVYLANIFRTKAESCYNKGEGNKSLHPIEKYIKQGCCKYLQYQTLKVYAVLEKEKKNEMNKQGSQYSLKVTD